MATTCCDAPTLPVPPPPTPTSSIRQVKEPSFWVKPEGASLALHSHAHQPGAGALGAPGDSVRVHIACSQDRWVCGRRGKARLPGFQCMRCPPHGAPGSGDRAWRAQGPLGAAGFSRTAADQLAWCLPPVPAVYQLPSVGRDGEEKFFEKVRVTHKVERGQSSIRKLGVAGSLCLSAPRTLADA